MPNPIGNLLTVDTWFFQHQGSISSAGCKILHLCMGQPYVRRIATQFYCIHRENLVKCLHYPLIKMHKPPAENHHYCLLLKKSEGWKMLLMWWHHADVISFVLLFRSAVPTHFSATYGLASLQWVHWSVNIIYCWSYYCWYSLFFLIIPSFQWVSVWVQNAFINISAQYGICILVRI